MRPTSRFRIDKSTLFFRISLRSILICLQIAFKSPFLGVRGFSKGFRPSGCGLDKIAFILPLYTICQVFWRELWYSTPLYPYKREGKGSYAPQDYHRGTFHTFNVHTDPELSVRSQDAVFILVGFPDSQRLGV